MSNKISSVLHKFCTHVEKLGLDENFLDVTQLVHKKMELYDCQKELDGKLYSSSDNLEHCICGCHDRLKVGAAIALELRNSLKTELGITSCAGISHNKLLAKLVCAQNKPDQQTTLSSNSIGELLISLGNVKKIPGIGTRTAEMLSNIRISTVSELQDCKSIILHKTFGMETARKLKSLSFGIDDTLVKQTGKPLSIGLEDSCKTISLKSEVEDKFKILLKRLMELQSEDGRIPLAVKVTLRKYDSKKNNIRETKQCSVAPSLFIISDKSITLAVGAQPKIISSIMRLFDRLVDIKKPFHITLLGLAFTKFQERKTGRSSITSFLMKNISVQSVTSFENSPRESPPSPMELSGSGSEIQTDNSDTEAEPSPKKAKLGFWIAKRRCLNHTDVASPSKLKVSELRLDSKEMERTNIDETMCDLNYPPGMDRKVFNELPEDVQKELSDTWKRTATPSPTSSISKPKPNNITRYFITNK